MRNRSHEVSHPLVQNGLHTYSLFKQVTFSLIKIITFIYTSQIQLCSFQMRQRLLEMFCLGISVNHQPKVIHNLQTQL